MEFCDQAWKVVEVNYVLWKVMGNAAYGKSYKERIILGNKKARRWTVKNEKMNLRNQDN